MQHTIGYRYQVIAQIGRGAMGAVYRVKDRLTAQIVALKQVTVRPQDQQFPSLLDYRLALANEFRTLASLRHPHIIHVYDYGFDNDDLPYFTMELLDRARPLKEFVSASIRDRVKLLIQILQALTYLHRHGLIHRDLKPSNVLVLEDGRAKLLDFGLAAPADNNSIAAGTLAYAAPELLFGEPATEASDLYSVGMLAFELLAGKHPFDLSNNDQLRRDIRERKPDLTMLRLNEDERREIAPIIGRLLSKRADTRYPNAQRVIRALSEAIHEPVPNESTGIRESFLQTANFVGRESELKKLTESMHAAIDGRGSGWMVIGEYGVGKSRLLEELRAQALVEGMTVVVGYTPRDGGLPYHPWRTIIRHMALFTHIDDFEAGVLKEIVPDIGTLLGKEVLDVPRLEGRDHQQRLSLSITMLFARQIRPILLLIEDVHWLQESLIPLRYLFELINSLPLMVVTSYNSEESTLAVDRLPPMNWLPLRRLNDNEVQSLAVSVLGDTAYQPELLELLSRETEGNAYFLVEVMRALAEDAGQLDRVGQNRLPEQVVTMGIMALAQRRLGRIQPESQFVLRLAAVGGRDLDLTILAHLNPTLNFERWLNECAVASILVYRENRWSFTHEKMREGVLYGVAASYRADLHRQYAEAVEAVFPDDPDYAMILLEHWHQAGDATNEARYAIVAAEQLWQLNSFARLRKVAERARIGLATSDPDGQHADKLIQLLYWQAQAQLRLGEVTNAHKVLEHCLELAELVDDPAMWVDVLRALIMTIVMEGDYEKAEKYARQALEAARELEDTQMTAEVLGLNLSPILFNCGDLQGAWDCGQEALKLLDMTGEVNQYSWHRARILSQLGEIARLRGESDHCLRLVQASLDIANRISDYHIIAYNTKIKGDLAVSERSPLAYRYYSEAIRMFKGVQERLTVAETFSDLARARIIINGDNTGYLQARQELREALQIAESVQVPALLIRVLLSVALYYMALQKPYWSAELVGGLRTHRITADLMPIWDELQHKLTQSLPAPQYDEALAHGDKYQDLHGATVRILKEWS
ncbi:MAG: DUF2791 family P-loop domain-containing protein [Anaerolineae bacterium]|nr:DUF2791 family P-loop domain-containing protein [Anaerolineae bacterium]